MTFPETYNLTNAKKEDINCSTVKKEWYLEEKLQVKSPEGNIITAYNMERTLCDILRKRNGVDTGVIYQNMPRSFKLKKSQKVSGGTGMGNAMLWLK